MQRKSLFWFALSLLCLTGAAYFWQAGEKWNREKLAAPATANTNLLNSTRAVTTNAAPQPTALTSSNQNSVASSTNRFAYPYRLTNSSATLTQLIHNEKAILLANALLDTSKSLNLGIPDKLRATPNSGSYIIQARGVLDDPFRVSLQNAGAKIISYIPNNAYLVRVSDAGAQQLAANPQTQSVLSYDPYYKLEAPLLKMAIEQPQALPATGTLNVTLFPDAYQESINALQQLGANIVGEDRSPFGPVLKVEPVTGTLPAIAAIPGVQGVAIAHARVLANDLVRPTLGITTSLLVGPNSYLGLSGSNVFVNINDGGVDKNHSDLTGRLFADFASALVDTDGHGTHVTGTILGTGSKSSTVTYAQGSVSNANFAGMAPNATAFVMSIYQHGDAYLQENAALTNTFISNNSWNYGTGGYDIAAASYDAAVRDALPEVTGPQPILYVFSAGNNGGANDDGSGGTPDTILSPATAKNVITVGATELPRFITNVVTVDGVPNNEIFNSTDNATEVADFSSRGNVGVNVEGLYGRFKPDVVSPGTFVISDASTTWDTNAYYNPTNFGYTTYNNQVVASNSIIYFSYDVPQGAIQLFITLSTNILSGTTNLPALPIYLKANDYPDATDFVGSNSIVLPTNSITLNAGDTLYFYVANNTTSAVNFNLTIEALTTNDVGDYYSVLQTLNSGVGPYYRYESGTSMAAAGVSGLLACMQEFFQSKGFTNSPALMKALLINGSRGLSDSYDFATAGSINPTSQGWGRPSLPIILPPGYTNLSSGNMGSMPVQFYDQNITNALVTGQQTTRNITVANASQSQDLRITLVWTDPPGNPTAGIKLVNDLDLIVTNLNTGEVFFGNDIVPGSTYNEAYDTNNAPIIDSVNNVENVYLEGPLTNSYSVTVYARRVNVNAVTGSTNGILQDYALVISSGSGSTATNALTVTAGTTLSASYISNLIVLSNAAPLLNQRVGANSQFSGSTNGTQEQWNFYVFTNTLALTNATFTNVVFATFLPPNLGVVRMGASQELAAPDVDATRYVGADVDLYVSTNPALTNLNPVVINSAFKSVGRTGSEVVFFTNSTPGQVYYIGVKAEDQEGAQFSIVGFATDIPLSGTDGAGNVNINMNPIPLVIPGGSSTSPSSVAMFGVCVSPIMVRKIVVTNSVTAQNFGDYVGSLSDGRHSAVLNNHSLFTNANDATEVLVYDDSGENEFPGSLTSAGPGSLTSFAGASSQLYTFTMVNDSSIFDNGKINYMTLHLEPQPPTGARYSRTIPADSWYYDYVDIPPNATNLTISVTGNTQPVDLYVDDTQYPTTFIYDDLAVIQTSGGGLSISKYSSPPLNAGRYYFGIFNPSTVAQNVSILVEVDLSLTPVAMENFLSDGYEPIPDDAVMDSTNHVSLNNVVVSADVGVRIQHPRESDLVLTLISPQGTRVLLSENRGGLDTNGYGAGVNITNAIAALTAGTGASQTNLINTINDYGTLIVSYNFFGLPDDMRVYYDGVRIFDSGLINEAGTFSIDFGPGSATSLSIVMNEAGTNPYADPSDQWQYSGAVVTKNITYATFTENTNYTTTPIKFAVPPFGAGPAFTPPQTNFTSSFEGVAAGDYTSTVDGWTVVGTNPVKVVTVPALANTGTNVLALHYGGITRALSTVAGQTYTLTFANHGRPVTLPIGWWKGENNAIDSAAGNNGTLVNVGFTNGIVGSAFSIDPENHGNAYCGVQISDEPAYILTNAVSVEAWIRPRGNGAVVLTRGDSRNGYDPYTLSFGFGDILVFQITGNSGAATQVQATLPYNQWYHVAGTFGGTNGTNGFSGVLSLYTNGILASSVITTNRPLGALIANDHPGVGIGNNNDGFNNFNFYGDLDEVTLNSYSLSAVQVADIYAAGSAGKCPVSGACTVNASVIFAGITNIITGIDQWTTNSYTFVAPSNGITLTILPSEDGMLVDSFQLVEAAQVNYTNYYLPEESLAKLTGENSEGDWLLEVLDNRAGPASSTNVPLLVSWQLSLVLADSAPFAAPLSHALPQTNIVEPNSIVYYFVDVPAWATFATNILSGVSGGSVNLLFNQNYLPGTNNSDTILLSGVTTSATKLLITNAASVPPLQPGSRYYLGVTNGSASPVSFTIEVDFNITTLTNAIPVTNSIQALNIPRYFQFDVHSNSVAAYFQILNPSGNVELVAKKGAPLPDTATFDYQSDVAGASPQNILVTTNSVPVPLSAGRWYLGVFNNDTNTVSYTIEATETGPPNIIVLTNDIPFNYFSPPGPALTNFFEFIITTNTPAALFELYNLSGDVDLTLQRESYPFANAPFGSYNSGTNSEQIVIRTNQLGTNIMGHWYLGVPNNTTSNVTFTIHAVISTNGLLVSKIPIRIMVALPAPGASTGPTLSIPAVNGEMYEIQFSTNLFNWTTLTTITASSQTLTYTDPAPIISVPVRFYRIIQIP